MTVRCPKDEIIWVSYLDNKGNIEYIITSKKVRDFYFLYQVEDKKLNKLGKSKNPIELETRFMTKKR